MKKEFKTISAKNFRDKDGYYVFPFEVLDKTPNGSNLGRIEWHLEPIKGKKHDGRFYIEKLYIWASQTRDKRYYGKVFEIPCYSESITADSLRKRSSYFHLVWRMMFCEMHNSVVFSAYPDDKHKELKINVGSSISIEIEFI